MNFQEYHSLVQSIASKPAEQQTAPYDNPLYWDITYQNSSTMNSWLETGNLSQELTQTLRNIDKPQQWLVITEPWSGDAAQNIPFIELASRQNPLIKLEIELRDTEPFTIEKYLTNGTKSIPKLIIRDHEGNDKATWGARPKECQELYLSLTAENASFDKLLGGLVNWYNTNKGADLQAELNALLS